MLKKDMWNSMWCVYSYHAIFFPMCHHCYQQFAGQETTQEVSLKIKNEDVM